MHKTHRVICRSSATCWSATRGLRSVAIAFLCSALTGCVALTNPVGNGIPVRRLPPELLGESRAEKQPLTLSLLRQKPPDVYRLAAGDVLAIWIETVLGESGQLPPYHFSETGNLPPTVGFPVPIRENGTIDLPFVEPLSLDGKTIDEALAAIRAAYTIKKRILVPGRDRIIVTLLRRRHYRVLVIREDSGGPATAPVGTSGGNRSVSFNLGATSTGASIKRGAGYVVELPAYENDVLTALTLTGGLPGLDAVNEVLIERGAFKGDQEQADILHTLETLAPGGSPWNAIGRRGQVVRIPLRLRPGEALPFRPEDIVLQEGDIVFIEARLADLFYTGGLLPPGEQILPRDHDLHVLEAVTRVGGPLISSGINPNNITGAFVGGGLGFSSPSLVAILRQAPGGGRVPIRVDLNRALRDPSEDIRILPGDIVLMQEKPSEALARYFTQTFRFSLFWQVIHGPHEQGSINALLP